MYIKSQKNLFENILSYFSGGKNQHCVTNCFDAFFFKENTQNRHIFHIFLRKNNVFESPRKPVPTISLYDKNVRILFQYNLIILSVSLRDS